MKRALYIFLIFIASVAHAQTFKVNATRFIGGDVNCSADASIGNAIKTADGGIAFVGITTCWDGEWEIPPNFPDTTHGAIPKGNLIVGKLDANLNVIWVRVYGGSNLEEARSIVETPDGGYAVLAGSESNDHDVSGNHGAGDLWLVRLDPNGNLLWQKCYGSPYDEQAISIALAPDNGFIMLGMSNGMGGDVPMHYSGSEFDYDWFVVKADDVGTIQWTKTIGGTGEETFYGKILAANDGYYLVSSSASRDHDCIDNSWHPASAETFSDYCIFKLDYSGNILWYKTFGGTNDDQAYNAVWDARDETINIVGFTESHDYMVTDYSGGPDIIWVMKADKNGNFKWGKCLGSDPNEEGRSICTTQAGYCVLGWTTSGSIGYYDNWIFALDINGATIANKQFGGLQREFPSTVVPSENGVIIVGGTTSSSFSEGDNLGHLSGATISIFSSKVVFWPLGIENTALNKEQLTISPNPSNSLVNITVPNSENGNIHICNSVGSTIYSKTITQNEQYITVNTLMWAKGLYTVVWIGEDGVTARGRLVNE